MRVGEALHPGPKTSLILGCINPSGIMHKLEQLKQLPCSDCTVWGVSESHLSRAGIAKFQRSLKLVKSRYRFHAGAPAPLRSTSFTAIGGKHTGTGWLSDAPSRQLHPTWPSEDWEHARFAMHSFLIQDQWIMGGVFYGFAQQAATQEGRNHTEKLLKNVVDRLIMSKGKRFLVGDFNQEYGALEQIQRLFDQGWRECQVLANEKYNRPISKTCHNATTKDFIWISPELIPFFRKVETCDQFPDHLTLYAEFAPFGKPPKAYIWKTPRPIDWTETKGILPNTGFVATPKMNTQEQMAKIASAFEDVVSDHLETSLGKSLHTSQRGRSATTQTKVVRDHTKPLEPTRHGHMKPNFNGQSLRHQQWYKQLRRLESLRRLIHSNRLSDSNQQVHAHREWRAVLHSSGFPMGFQTWWKSCPHKSESTPHILGWEIPSPTMIDEIISTFETNFREYEEILIKDLKATARANRVADPNKIFADIKLPTACPVEMLDDSCTSEILEIDHEDNSITLTKPAQFDENFPIYTAQGIIDPIVCTEDKIWVDKVDHLDVTSTLYQEKFIGDLETLFRRFGDEWQKRWDRHLHVPVEFWDPVVAHFTQNVPRGNPMPHEKISVQTWRATLAKKKKKAAPGPDGWTKMDLLHMPLDQTEALLDLLYAIECGRQWPPSLLVGIVHSLEKVPHASKVNQYRPITLFSVIYRCWSSIRSRQALRHLAQHAPTGCHGNVPNRSAAQVWLGIQAKIEAANHDEGTISGAIVDVVKCFNHLPRTPIMEVVSHLGLHPNIVSTWFRALQGMTRRFSIRGSVGPPIKSTTGCAEGCGLSVVGMFAINCLIDCYMRHRTPK